MLGCIGIAVIIFALRVNLDDSGKVKFDPAPVVFQEPEDSTE